MCLRRSGRKPRPPQALHPGRHSFGHGDAGDGGYRRSGAGAVGRGGTAIERANKQTVAQAYAEWAAGGTGFFDILDDRVVWTILGAGPHAKTYNSKAAFLQAAVAPFSARLSSPLRPTVRSIHADGDEVITLWDGIATTRDGRTYRNTYAWFFTMRAGRVVRVYDAMTANKLDNRLSPGLADLERDFPFLVDAAMSYAIGDVRGR